MAASWTIVLCNQQVHVIIDTGHIHYHKLNGKKVFNHSFTFKYLTI